jgi:hypothetical protein
MADGKGKAAHTNTHDHILSRPAINDEQGSNNHTMAAQQLPDSQPPPSKCPQCGSTGPFYRDGIRKTSHGDVQRWLCTRCSHRFSENNGSGHPYEALNRSARIPTNRQVCDDQERASGTGLVLELAEVEPLKDGLAGATEQAGDIKAKILEYLWTLQKRGLKERTVEHYGERLRCLLSHGVDLRQPDEVKRFLATKDKWSERTKAITVASYDGFLKWLDVKWDPPIYKPAKTLPYVPTEELVDCVIARAGKRLAPFLQLLKETGCRRGEAVKIRWVDIDSKRGVVYITPEKGSNPRILPLSDKAFGMLQTMPKTSDRVFTMTLAA